MPRVLTIICLIANTAWSATPDLRRNCWNSVLKSNPELSSKAAAFLCAEVQAEPEVAKLIECWRQVYTAYPDGRDIRDTDAAILCAHRIFPDSQTCVGK